MNGLPWYMWVILIFFVSAQIYGIVAISQATGSSDNKKEMSSAITNVVIINSILTAILAGAAFFYTTANPESRHTYTFIMVHIALLLSIISVSVTSLHQLDSSAVQPPGKKCT